MKDTFVYKIASYIWRKTYVKYRNWYREVKYRRYWEEHRTCEGNRNADKTFYIVRRREVYIGLFSYYMTNICQVKKALEKGYIPVIDLQNNANMYLKQEQIGKVNAWEYYFEQPCGYTLDDVKGSKNIILGSGYWREYGMFPYNDVNYLMDRNGEIAQYREIARKYFKFNETVQQKIDAEWKPFEKKNVLGVLCRGTDYTSSRPKGHNIQPSLQQMFDKVNNVLQDYGCDAIFLGTEDKSIYDKFKEKYGDIVYTNRKKFIEYHGEKSIGKLVTCNIDDAYDEGLEYLVTIALLAKCRCFVGGHTSGTVGVMLMNEAFEYCYIFDLGLYE